MLQFIRTDSNNEDFKRLVKQLDAYLAIQDGEEHAFYDQFNKISNLKYAIVVYEDNKAVSCGAIKPFDNEAMEVKRMFTLPEKRGQGFAAKVLHELEQWSKELGFNTCVLETGKRQPEAIRLYEKNGYKSIPNYGQYTGVENSVCFEKQLT